MSNANAKQMQKPKTAITPTRDDDFPEWYQQVIKASDMAENSPVRGCMTIKPYGYALWENIVGIFDKWLKDYEVQNSAFPLLIPVSFLAKEAEHVEGFAKECAVVTHHRLKADGKGGLEPASPLEEPYVVRPTSETIIGEAMARWIQSYRDLPLKLNQWGSVLRWEMRTRMFLRTSEFFWHEGHCAFENKEGAVKDCMTVLDMYERFFEDYLAFTGYKGVKTPEERFPGADDTFAFEAMMQDGKALQAATTHNLGINFAKSCGIKYQSKSGEETFAHTTSWAFSSRVIGAMIMIHADDDGMIMPPRVAPHQVVILPVLKDEAAEADIMAFCDKIATSLKAQNIRVKLDNRDMRTPDKMWDAVKKGIPLRVEIGQREMEQGEVTFVRRDIGRDSKTTLPFEAFLKAVPETLDAIHDALLEKSRNFTKSNTQDGASVADIDAFFSSGKIGFVKVPVEVLKDPSYDAVRSKHGLSSRVMPFADNGEKVLVAKAY
ncbi:MAG: proline--tRNA ligase [Alphaproteobacteria bacterium]